MPEIGIIRLLVVDDHLLVRRSIASLIKNVRDIIIVSEAIDGPDAIAKERIANPSVVLLDVNMPGMDGIECAQLILRQNPKQTILMISQHEEPLYVERSIAIGTKGYVLKRKMTEDLSKAIRLVAGGGTFFPQPVL